MGLNDTYYQQPWTPNQGMSTQLNQGLSALGQVPMYNAQVDAQRQANTDAAYTSPAKQANPNERVVGEHYGAMFNGAPPEFVQRLKSEFAKGPSLVAPQSQPQPGAGPAPSPYPQGGGQGPMDVRRAMPPSPQGLGAVGVNMPRPDSDERDFLGTDVRESPYNGDMTGMQRPPQVPQVQLTQKPQTPQPQGGGGGGGAGGQRPMTRGDVELFMRAAPNQRMGIENAKLEEKKRQFDTMMEYRNRALQGKKDMHALAQRVRMATSDVDRKYLLELMKIKVQEMSVHAGIVRSTASGITGVINDQQSQQAAAEADQDLAEGQNILRQMEEEARKGVTNQTPTRSKTGAKDTTTIRIKRSGQPGTIEAWEFNPKTDVKE